MDNAHPPENTSSRSDALKALLEWYQEMGIEIALNEDRANFYEDFADQSVHLTPPSSPQSQNAAESSAQTGHARAPETKLRDRSASKAPTTAIMRPKQGALNHQDSVAVAKKLATECQDIKSLEDVIRAFDGCSLKSSARNTVISDGIHGAPLMVIGEAPGNDEDREGRPFVGRAGLLLDRMLKAIDRDRAENTIISNVVFWRPPGNRNPTPEEIAVCHPFIERFIELNKPSVIFSTGAIPLLALLNKTGIMRTRGKWQKLTTSTGFEVDIMPSFHPAYLLRNPQAKAHAWTDLQLLAERL